MYCTNCGNELAQDARFCSSCGKAAAQNQLNDADVLQSKPYAVENPIVEVNQDRQQSNSGLVGFSPKINDPAYTKYKKNSNSWSFIFSLILALAAVIGFPIYGKSSGELEWPQSLYFGLGIGGMFVLIALIQIIKRGKDSTWDGVVIDKRTYKKTSTDNDSNTQRHYTEYVLKVRADSGKVKKHKFIDQPAIYNYYETGDRVRHHKGFSYYEKYDKTRDSKIICAACLTMNDIKDDVCFRCKCPLLK